jgi:hypothetical protein
MLAKKTEAEGRNMTRIVSVPHTLSPFSKWLIPKKKNMNGEKSCSMFQMNIYQLLDPCKHQETSAKLETPETANLFECDKIRNGSRSLDKYSEFKNNKI